MRTKLVPPDGGWGWFIALAYSVNMICTIPVMQGFGLLYRGLCSDLGMTGTDISVIISVNSAFGMGLGLINGPLLRYFGYRKVAIVGALCHATGLTLSAGVNSFHYLIITYGILCSLGTGVTLSAFSLALNSYFLKKRGRAVGLAMTLNGLGPILAPQLISFLISYYGPRGAIAILGAISFHALAASLTLQPIKWHLKRVADTSDIERTSNCSENKDGDQEIGKQIISTSGEDLEGHKRKRTMTMSSIDHDVSTGNIYGFETPLPRKKSTTYPPVSLGLGITRRRCISQTDAPQPPITPTERIGLAFKWWNSEKSLATVNLGSSYQIFDESGIQKGPNPPKNLKEEGKGGEQNPSETQALVQKKIVHTVKEEKEDEEDEEHNPPAKETKKKSAFRRALRAIVVFFDFDLLHDPVYVNIMLGMSIAMFSEMNFAILTPFILGEMNLDTEQIATVMSCLAVSDLMCRGVAPFLGEWLKQTARVMYMISLVLLVAARTGLLFAEGFLTIMFIGVALGIGKGVRSVYMTLVISNYVPIEKLASASGIQMVTNGLIIMTIGPLLGLIKDKTGSYNPCIMFINGITVLTLAMWMIEMMARRSTSKRSRTTENSAESKRGFRSDK